MAKFEGFKCDECQTEKKISNHWIIGFVRDRQINLIPWQDDMARQSGDAIHLCGAGCVAKVVSREIHAWQEPVAEAKEIILQEIEVAVSE